MYNKNHIVVTAYGHEKTVDKMSVSLFEESPRYRFGKLNSVESYCKSINSLELKGDAWIFARIIEENEQYSINSFLPSVKFIDMIPLLDNRSIQMVLREVDSSILSVALKDVEDTIRENIFKNMSHRAITMLKEDMENMGPVSKTDCENAQEKILTIILHLEDTGEIVLRRNNE